MSHEEHCNCCQHNSELTQTLSELDFERGIWNAVIYNEFDRVKMLIDKGHVNFRDNFGYTALHYAARNGNEKICRLLIDSKCEVNARTRSGVTALHRAAMVGNLEIVIMLLEAGTDISVQDEDGQTALHRSAVKGDIPVSQYLIDYCNKLKYIKDKKNRIPYDLVANENHQLRTLLRPIE